MFYIEFPEKTGPPGIRSECGDLLGRGGDDGVCGVFTKQSVVKAEHTQSSTTRRDARVVEWARLERVCGSNLTEGSNPSLSAINFCKKIYP